MDGFLDATNPSLGLLQTVLALSLYTIVTSITPGPNNMMVLASGVNFGVRRTVPHILGISLGFAAMIVVVGMGLGTVFELYPVLNTVLRWVGAAYLVYLAYKIARSGAPETPDGVAGKPLGFLGAAAFQWVNPKAWVMALGAVAAYLPAHPSLVSVTAIALLMAVLNAPCVGIWAAFGVGLRSFLTKPDQLRAFNLTMAVLLVVSLYPIVIR
ncbi:LysE family translocator [Brucella intermedia]|uniref:LysE family translocator n=1 Tax=Brucella intermedia TaxID=94625 RepID=UPI000FAA2092|nr:LysE family translocator [Brucella intermedia]KAB2707159.1 LysE family translocator [Brucella intermedia]